MSAAPQGEGQRSVDAAAWRLVSTYAIFACLWILLSDKLVSWLFSDPLWLAWVSTLKGWFFVAVTALLLYGLVRRLLSQAMKSSHKELDSQREKTHALQLLATIADNSSDAIFAKDLEGRYLLANREVCRVMNRNSGEVLGLDDSILFTPEEALAIRANDARVVERSKIESYEEAVSTIDGQRLYLATKGPLCDDEGRVVGIFGISRDITERKVAEATLRKLSQAIEQSSESIVITDTKGDIDYVKEAFVRVTGY